MLLIAIGLTMCVMVGVPVLLVSMDAISNASQFESAQSFAYTVHNITSQVDTGQTNDTSIEIRVPEGVNIRVESSQLIIEYQKEGTEPVSWDVSYTHTLDVDPPTTTGLYLMRVRLVGNEILIAFTPLA